MIHVERVPLAVVRPLRRAILRPGLPPQESVYAQDELPDTVHLAALDESGVVQGCSTWFADPWATRPDAYAWRLRGMATSPAVRGTGAGGLLLLAGLAVAREAGAELLWCQARTPAAGFYERYGLQRVGAEFLAAHGVPHYEMWIGLTGP